MAKIVIEIENCKECPHFYIDNGYSTDGFDFMEDWNCKKMKRKIQGGVGCVSMERKAVSSHRTPGGAGFSGSGGVEVVE